MARIAKRSPRGWERPRRSLPAGEFSATVSWHLSFIKIRGIISSGRHHKLLYRAVYASTRSLIGKTDGGRTIPNYAFLIGSAGAAGLITTSYPEKNQGGGQVAQTFGSGIGGAAFGNLFNEFGGDIIQALHLSRNK